MKLLLPLLLNTAEKHYKLQETADMRSDSGEDTAVKETSRSKRQSGQVGCRVRKNTGITRVHMSLEQKHPGQ